MQLMDSFALRKNNCSRSCANKLGGDWERKQVQQTAKRYDDDHHSKYIWLRLLLLVAVIMAAKAVPPRTNIRQITNRLL